MPRRASRPLFALLAIVLPGCLVSFDDWSDESGSAAGGTTTSSGPFGGASAAVGASGGQAGSATGSSSSGGAQTGSSSSGGAQTGSSSSGGASSSGGSSSGGTGSLSTVASRGTIRWLTLSGALADGDSEPNAALGVDGTFYGYADACALSAMSFTESTRCLSGTLCDPGTNFENWGVALGFDILNVGGTKYVWDPRAVGAIGLAWVLSGVTTSSLQLWVQNMDASWAGACSAESCAIDGPPDGDDAIGSTGELYFDSMTKDNWNGSGTDYVYDPAATFSLQFKIPTVNVPGASYSFCIEQLGLVFAD